MVGKNGESGKLLAGKCWCLEGNFGILREILESGGKSCHFVHKNRKIVFKLGTCLPGNKHFFKLCSPLRQYVAKLAQHLEKLAQHICVKKKKKKDDISLTQEFPQFFEIL